MSSGGPFVVLSGAGLSTASGIPAYRDRHGQWVHPPPIQHQEFLRSDAVRRRYWARSFAGWPVMGQAQPNPGHRALAALEAMGKINAVITQNVDGLHQKAGSIAVLELHGGIDRVRCLSCDTRHPRADVQTWLHAANPDLAARPANTFRPAPDGDAVIAGSPADFHVPACPACGGVLKPDVVFFGDSVPRERVAAAQRAIEACAALLIVGSSLMTYSGFRFADQAHRAGKPVFAINQGVTRADALLTAKTEADCGAVLGRLQKALA